MTIQTKRSRIKPGDLAYVANVGLGGLPLFRITKLETDGDGTITVYHLTAEAAPDDKGQPVPANRVIAVFSNVLNQE